MLSDCPEGSIGYDEFRNPPGLEQPLFDPVAFLTGFATGFFKGLGARFLAGTGNSLVRAEIVAQEGAIVEILGQSGATQIRVMAEMLRHGDDLVLRGAHIEGAGAGTVGIRALMEIGRAFGRQQGVKRVIVGGARRTTGARPGRIPRPIVIPID